MRLLFFSLCLLISFNSSAQMENTGYSAGVVVANDLISQGLDDLDLNAFFEAITDVYTGKDLKISKAEAQKQFSVLLKESQLKKHQANRTAGEKFLLENGARKEVSTTITGLQYQVLEASDNPRKPTLNDKVKVHYHGTLTDGTVFDSSMDRGEPISFPLNGVISGWQEGLQLMTVGSKFRFFIPYNLAYGERAAGPTIQPYSALIFDVSLLAIE